MQEANLREPSRLLETSYWKFSGSCLPGDALSYLDWGALELFLLLSKDISSGLSDSGDLTQETIDYLWQRLTVLRSGPVHIV